jgi:hypothetical protein
MGWQHTLKQEVVQRPSRPQRRVLLQYSNTPLGHNLATADVETGFKLIEHRGGKALREDVGELRCRRDM